MAFQKRWSFGFGTIFSLIIVYFIYLYSKDKGWAFLAFISKWYLIIVGGLILLSLLIVILILLLSLFGLTIAMIKMRKLRKKANKKDKNYIDIDYKIKN